jgi:hypothetical protein
MKVKPGLTEVWKTFLNLSFLLKPFHELMNNLVFCRWRDVLEWDDQRRVYVNLNFSAFGANIGSIR